MRYQPKGLNPYLFSMPTKVLMAINATINAIIYQANPYRISKGYNSIPFVSLATVWADSPFGLKIKVFFEIVKQKTKKRQL